MKKRILGHIINNIGPKEYIILSGIAAWDPGQLDFEIDQGGWNKKLNSYISIFGRSLSVFKPIILFI